MHAPSRSTALLLCLSLVNLTLARASHSPQKPTSDIAQRIQTAHTVYLVNSGSDPAFARVFPGGDAFAYKQLTTSLNLWGHFRLTPALEGADLVFDIRSIHRESCSDTTDDNGVTTTSCGDYYFYILAIKDPATLTPLWSITAPADTDFNHKGGVPGIARSITDLTSRLKLLSGQTLSKQESASLANHHYLGPLLLVGLLGTAAGTVFAIRQLSANKHCHPGIPCDVFK